MFGRGGPGGAGGAGEGARARPRGIARRAGDPGHPRGSGGAGPAGAAHRRRRDRPPPARSTSTRCWPARGRPRSSCSRTRGRWGTSAPASGRRGGRRRRRSSPPARTTPGTPTRSAAPPASTSRSPSPGLRGCRRASGRWSRSTPTATSCARPICRPGAILAFGTERHGLSDELLERADLRLGIPMRPGVSSLNLAHRGRRGAALRNGSRAD